MSETSTSNWEIEQLVKSRLFPNEHAVLRSALRTLFQAQPGIRQQMVVSAYTAGEISLGKAAEMIEGASGWNHYLPFDQSLSPRSTERAVDVCP